MTRAQLYGAIVSLWLIGCSPGGSDAEAPEPNGGSLTDNQRWLAEKLYEDQTCAMCHGPSGEGGELGPPLGELQPYWDESRLAEYLADPEAFADAHPDFGERREREYSMKMPAYANLSQEELRLLSRWLLERTESR